MAREPLHQPNDPTLDERAGSSTLPARAAPVALPSGVLPVSCLCPAASSAPFENFNHSIDPTDNSPCWPLSGAHYMCMCHSLNLEGGMANWTARLVAVVLASFPGVASARTCDAMPHGPERTDCYLALSQFYRAQSNLAAAKARAQSDAAWYRAITGTDPPTHNTHRRR